MTGKLIFISGEILEIYMISLRIMILPSEIIFECK